MIDAIFRAIQAEQKISFQYFRFDANRERVPRHDGEPFVLSPYAMLYNEDKYYVLGYYRLFGKITTFRVDRRYWPIQPTRNRKGSTLLTIQWMFSVCMKAVWKQWSYYVKTA